MYILSIKDMIGEILVCMKQCEIFEKNKFTSIKSVGGKELEQLTKRILVHKVN